MFWRVLFLSFLKVLPHSLKKASLFHCTVPTNQMSIIKKYLLFKKKQSLSFEIGELRFLNILDLNDHDTLMTEIFNVTVGKSSRLVCFILYSL